MEATMTNSKPVCPYCPDKPVMICIADDLYECPECCYEENLQTNRPPASDLAKKLIDAGVYDAEPISYHIPDASKMDTPRTDEVMKTLDDDGDSTFGYAFARQLERELAEAKASLDRGAETAAKMLEATIKERDKARECLREAIAYRDRTMSGYDLQEWIEALGDKQ
jgi:hypothetical protein